MSALVQTNTSKLKTLFATLFRGRPDPYYERLACSWLRLQGLRLLARSYACRQGEVDLIMRDNQTVVFIEVKYRSQSGTAIVAINSRKQKRIARAAYVFISRNPHLSSCPMRFDAVTIERPRSTYLPNVKWYPGAFDDT